MTIDGNSGETICTITENKNGEYEIYKGKSFYQIENNKPDYIAQTKEEASSKIEEICREHYFEKYGTVLDFFHCCCCSKNKTKRLSVGEICEWYERFRRLDMSILEIEKAIRENKMLKREMKAYDDMLIKVGIRRNLYKKETDK